MKDSWIVQSAPSTQGFNMSLNKAQIQINKIMLDAEATGLTFNEVMNILQRDVKIYGLSLSTLMLIKIVEDFVGKRGERKEVIIDETHVQEAFDNTALKWNS
jgi:hypothetical protein